MPQSLFKYNNKHFSSIILFILILVLWADIPAQKLPENISLEEGSNESRD
jgi:hypothetical protein